MAYLRCTGTLGGSLKLRTAQGEIASFETNLPEPYQSVTVDVEATQSGSGTPYPPGGGKNKFDKATVNHGYLINGAGNYVSYPDNNVSDYTPVVEGVGYYLYGLTKHPNTNQDNFELFDASKTKVGYANVKTNEYPYTIPSGVKFVRFTVHDDDLNTAMFATSEGEYEPYSNVRPITGFDELNVVRTGVNLWELSDDTKNDGDRLTIEYINNGIKLTANDLYARASYVFNVKAGQTYTLSYYGYGTGNFIQVYYNDAITWNPQNYGRQLLTSTKTKYTKTITATSDILFVGFYVTTTGTTGDMVIEDFMLEIGSTASDTFTPYTGNTYTIAFGQTVYGGVLDVTRGKLHVTHGKYTLNDVSNLSRNSDHSFYFGATPAPKATGTAYYVGVMSDKFTPGETANQDVIFIHPNGLVRFNTANAYQSASDCFTAIGEITVVYPLATPFDIDLTPEVISAVVGTNNVFADCGETEVKYLYKA